MNIARNFTNIVNNFLSAIIEAQIKREISFLNFSTYQVGLELSKIDVKGTIESERSGDGRDDLTDETVQVGVGGALDVEVTSADVVDSLNLLSLKV